MKRVILKNITVFLILCLAAMTVVAGFRPSFGGGGNGSIVVWLTYQGNIQQLDGTMAGSLTPICQNPAGNIAPGQIKQNVFSYPETVDVYDRKSGNDSADVQSVLELDPNALDSKNTKLIVFRFPDPLEITGLPNWQAAGCPNSKWSVNSVTGPLRFEISASTNARADFFVIECLYDSAATGPFVCELISMSSNK